MKAVVFPELVVNQEKDVLPSDYDVQVLYYIDFRRKISVSLPESSDPGHAAQYLEFRLQTRGFRYFT